MHRAPIDCFGNLFEDHQVTQLTGQGNGQPTRGSTMDMADVRPASVARKAFETRIRDGGELPAPHHVFEPR